MIRRCPECHTDLSYEEAWHGQAHTCSICRTVDSYIEQKEKQSKALKQYYIDRPNARKEHSKKMKRYYIDNPEARKKISGRMKRYWINQNMKGDQNG